METNDKRRSEAESITQNQDGEARGDENALWIHVDGNGIGEDRRTGGKAGGEPFRSVGTNNPSNYPRKGEIDIRLVLGKILSRVDELEKKHLAYVEAHERRLEQRLQESKVSKDEAMHLIDEIRELTRLLEEAAEDEEE